MNRFLKKEYNFKKKAIKKRLKEFRAVWTGTEKRIFSELCFCICTPQSRAILCDKAISSLVKTKLLFNGNLRQIKNSLKGVRFPNNKAKFILNARKLFTVKKNIEIKNKIDIKDIYRTREWFVKNVKGIGFKEASHFLRNIGFGENLAILDVHILKNMRKYGIIKEIPKSITESAYLFLEKNLKTFSKKANILMGELDLLFWSAETGEIFK